MGIYVPSTDAEKQEMLSACGVSDIKELYRDVPADMFVDGPLNLPEPMNEMELRKKMEGIAAKNRIYGTILRGAGAYDHYIPYQVSYIPTKEELQTAYTPYQAEISQGVLQSIFEYQTLMCEITGLDVSNAGVYDGATAAAEAITCCQERKRSRFLISETVNPEWVAVMKTYSYGSGVELTMIPAGADGLTDLEALKGALDDGVSGVFVQQLNFFGLIEDCAAISAIAHEAGAKFVMGVNPIAAAVLSSAAECDADFAVGEAQPLGLPLAFGGPYLGFMTVKEKFVRNLCGRIVGQTEDVDGKRAFVLTLQAREQHIRREKATSNICSNEALCGVIAEAYLAVMGPEGLKEVANQCYSKAHYLFDGLTAIDGINAVYDGEFFHEFLTDCGDKTDKILEILDENDILGGLPTDKGILWCVTEKADQATLDLVSELVKEVCA